VEVRFGAHTVAVTHPERVVFPADGITKGEVVAYYRDIADFILPWLRGRPLTIERFTKTIDDGGFYQKHAPKHYPAWIPRVELGGKTAVNYAVCDTPAALVYIANQGAVTFHVWTSRGESPFRPEEVVIDLDPPVGRFDLVRRVARLVRDLLAELGLPAFVKTTGSKGLHIVSPVDGAAAFDEVLALCGDVAAHLCRRHPDLVTMEFYKDDRRGRLYLDVGRNAPGATFVAPYSVRPRPGAPVSAPIDWRDVDDPAVAADGIRMRDVRARIDARGDPWATLRDRPGSVAAARTALARIAGPS